jgi:ribosomal protein L24E
VTGNFRVVNPIDGHDVYFISEKKTRHLAENEQPVNLIWSRKKQQHNDKPFSLKILKIVDDLEREDKEFL